MRQFVAEEFWFAVQVTPRHEKKVDIIFGVRSYEHFLPLYLARRKWSDRVKIIEEPLFPGYVFVKTRRSLVGSLLALPGVIRIVSFSGMPCPIPEEEIKALQLIYQSKRDVCSFPYLNTGQKVRIISGPLCGVTGIITKWKKRDRLIITLEAIVKSISIEVDGLEVLPIYQGLIA